MMTRRQDWIDVARGLAIIFVVLHHVIEGLKNAGLTSGSVELLHAVVQPPMLPTFFFLSGLLSVKALNKGWASTRERIALFLWLYVLWSLIEFAIRFSLSGVINNPVEPGQLVRLPWDPLFGGWFIYGLAIFTLLGKLFLPRPRLGMGVAVAMFLASFLVPSSGETSLLYDVLALFVVFYAGLIWGGPLTERLTRAAPATALAVAALSVALSSWAFSMGLHEHPAIFAALSLIATPALLMVAVAIDRLWRRGDPLPFIGRRTLDIYLLQFLPAGAAHVVVRRLPFEPELAATALVATAAAIAFCLMAKAVLEGVGLRWLFDLPRPSRKQAASAAEPKAT